MTDERPFNIPLVSVTSRGGPFDDESYKAGFELGQFSAMLSALPDTVTHYAYPIMVRVSNLHQMDLVAMNYNFCLHVTQIEEACALVVVTRSRPLTLVAE